MSPRCAVRSFKGKIGRDWVGWLQVNKLGKESDVEAERAAWKKAFDALQKIVA